MMIMRVHIGELSQLGPDFPFSSRPIIMILSEVL